MRTGARYGLANEELAAAFWRDVAAEPDRASEATRRTTDGHVEPFRPEA